MSDDPIEKLIAEIVDAEPVYAMPEFTDELLYRFCQDVAQGIHSPDTIARRYGFANPRQMLEFIKEKSEVRRRIKLYRSVWQSDGSLEVRLRTLAGHTLLEGIPLAAKPLLDGNATAATRLDTLKAFSRIAGVDGVGAGAQQQGKGGQGGSQFAINIFMGDDKPVSITTVVDAQIEADPDQTLTIVPGPEVEALPA